MTTARMTVGALFGTVTTAANAVSGTINGVSKGIGMFDTWIDGVAEEQRLRGVGHKAKMKRVIAEELAQEQAERQARIAEFRSKSQGHAAAYDEAFNEFEALLKDA